MSELANLIAEMGRASERGNPSYLRVISSRLFSGEKWQRMMELAQAAVVEPPRRKLARKLAVITRLTVSDVLINLQHLTDEEVERFLAPGANIEQALDLATLRRVAPQLEKKE